VLSDGSSVEAATLGDEGFVGISAFFIDTCVSPRGSRRPGSGAGADRRAHARRRLPPRA
jgi:hypothetical protein